MPAEAGAEAARLERPRKNPPSITSDDRPLSAPAASDRFGPHPLMTSSRRWDSLSTKGGRDRAADDHRRGSRGRAEGKRGKADHDRDDESM
jgi:hypothetical protein